MRQFKQNVDSMEAFVRVTDVNAEDPGLYRRLAYHLVMSHFTVPQALEGLNVDLCRPFIKTVHDGVILAKAIANGTSVLVDNRRPHDNGTHIRIQAGLQLPQNVKCL